jgi:mRNA interferase MazF
MIKYDIHWVDLEPTKGAMMKKTRPAVIVSPSEQNKYLKTIVICPLTSKVHEQWPTRVQTIVDGIKGEIAIDQIRTIPKESLKDRIKSLSSKEKYRLEEAIIQYFSQN